MPIVEITLLEGRSPQKKVALMRKVTDAVVEAIDAPRDSVRVILREIPPEHFAAGGEPKKMPDGVE
ncbi:MAG: hypothetical protein VR70_00445 [Rhodospirillaceae bacterium BRH_c57]|nr:MAG: hypothetical protein VR70_00445 [Rhodospirillaceae bacterium BRH_c57]